MGLFKPDFYRFFAFGFVAGAVLVFGTLGNETVGDIASGAIPVASAAPAR